MLILAFDCSGPGCAVALWRDGAVLAAERRAMERGQAEVLMPMIEEIMERAHVRYTAIDRLAVTVGPGSFTGVRVGLAAARGLALASAKTCIGVLTTEVIAAAARDSQAGGDVLVAIDTKRGDLYVQRFSQMAVPLGAPLAMAVSDLQAWWGEAPVIVAGDGADAALAVLGQRARRAGVAPWPDPALIATLAATRDPTPGGPLPVYVHEAAVTLPSS